jgi:hypothetical protein
MANRAAVKYNAYTIKRGQYAARFDAGLKSE